MDNQLRNIILLKIFKTLKFYNDESHSEYLELMFSPFYRELFDEARKECLKLEAHYVNDDWYEPELEPDSEHFNRIKTILLSVDKNNKLSFDQKTEMIKNVIYPYKINEQQMDYFVSII